MSLGNVAQGDFGSKILNDNVYRQKVSRCERVAANLYQLAVQRFHDIYAQELCHVDHIDHMNIIAISFSADATGACIFKTRKCPIAKHAH